MTIHDEEGLAFVVRHMDLDFLAPARMDDVVEILTRPHRVGRAKLVLDQEIRAGDRLQCCAPALLSR